MKSVALILCFTIVGTLAALSDSEKNKLKELHEKCQGDPATHVDREFFDKVRSGQKPTSPPSNLGAHILCMYKGAGFMKEDGTLDKQVIREKVEAHAEDKSQVDAIVTECAVDKETPEKTAGHLFFCLFRKHISLRHGDQ